MLKLIREASKTYHQFQQLGPQFLDTFDQRPITEATMEAIKTKQLQEYIKREFKPIGEISMLPIHSEPNHQFTIALFAIMAGTMMPLHDHPNMFVLTHVMSGVGERESWDVDLEDLDKQNKFRNNRMVSQFVKAKENERVQLTEGVNCFTTPNKHNLHRFINKSPRELFVFLDVILPHYNEQDRVISFYEPVSKNELQMLSQPRQYTRHPIKDIDIQEFLVQ